MSWYQSAHERIRALLWKAEEDADMGEEFRFHIDMETEKYLKQGMTPAEARRRALVAFGGVDRFTEQTRDERGATPVQDLIRDVRLALRRMRRNPGFAAVTALTVGLGVGATVLGFVIADAVVFRPLPYPEPDRLVRIQATNPGGSPGSVSAPDYLDLTAAAKSFDRLVAVNLHNMVVRSGNGPYQAWGMSVTPGYFEMLGALPALGRAFVDADASPASEGDVVVLSQGLWRQLFSSDPGILGSSIDVDGKMRTVVGIAPADLRPLFGEQMWVPFGPDPAFSRADHRLEVVGHLAPGATLADARADLARVAANLSQRFPDSNTGWGFFAQSFPDWLIAANVRRTVGVLAGAGLLLLLLACTSVSALLVARVSAREHELAMRRALGARPSRLMRQLLVESLVLATGGAIVGMVMAVWLAPIIQRAGSAALPRLSGIGVHGGALVVALAVTMVAGILFGMVPAVHATRGDSVKRLQGSNRNVSARGGRIRDGMVVGQMALAVMLLVAAALLGDTFVRLSRVDPGFRTEDVLAVRLAPRADRYQEGQRPVSIFYHDVLERVRAIPGVAAAGASIVYPFQGPAPSNQVAARGRANKMDDFIQIAFRIVTPGFFEAMRIPLVEGRYLDEADNSYDRFVAAVRSGTPGPLPVMVTTLLAERLWPGEDAVGKHMVWNMVGGADLMVVGIVNPIRDLDLATSPTPMAFLPNGIVAFPQMTLLVRTQPEVTGMASAVRQAIWEVDADTPVPNLTSLGSSLNQQLARPRLTMVLVSALAVVALLMATLSLYGVVSFATMQRTREIGIRVALGASRGHVVTSVVGRALRVVVGGAGVGVIGALALSRVLRSILFGVEPTNVITYVVVVVTLCLAALLASYLPARRATRVEPRKALVVE
jgi:putative ABC transport system permease protein